MPMAGEWERECRHAGLRRMNASSGGYPTLLEVCGENIDCTFELLEPRPSTDVLEQIALCKYTGDYGRDCTGHAMQRWHSKPGRRHQSAQTPTDGQIGSGTTHAVNVACGKTGSVKETSYANRMREGYHLQRNPDAVLPKKKTIASQCQATRLNSENWTQSGQASETQTATSTPPSVNTCKKGFSATDYTLFGPSDTATPSTLSMEVFHHDVIKTVHLVDLVRNS